ncbi:MAG: hypothetical protein HKN76_20020 [Saprospiraceae bacterium]|nr:hypothetical protein [Saprospiraceae bacterium]
MKLYSLLLLTSWVITSCGITVEESEPKQPLVPAESYESLSSDGAWCWFSDPRAVYYKGNREQLYFGHVNSLGDVMIGSRDMVSHKVQSFVLHDTLEVDDHNVPSILVLPSGHLLAFYNEHNGHVFMRKSTRTEDVTAWDQEQIISQANDTFNYCYTNPARLSDENGRIFLVGRKVGPTRSFEHWQHYLRFSNDEGQTWSDELTLLDNQGRQNPPYLKITTDHRGRIDFLFTDGHPKIGSDVSTYHMYYQGDSFYQTSGDPICPIEKLPIAIKSVNKVYDAVPTQIRSWIWDIALKDGKPVITYARYHSEHDHIYHYAHWNGDQWEDHEIVNSGSWMPSLWQGDVVREAHYSGGIVLNHADPTEIFLSRNIAGKFEMERRRLLPTGRWSSTPITENSTVNNVRPYVVDQCPPGQTILLWMHGLYRHYTEFDVEIKMGIIK